MAKKKKMMMITIIIMIIIVIIIIFIIMIIMMMTMRASNFLPNCREISMNLRKECFVLKMGTLIALDLTFHYFHNSLASQIFGLGMTVLLLISRLPLVTLKGAQWPCYEASCKEELLWS